MIVHNFVIHTSHVMRWSIKCTIVSVSSLIGQSFCSRLLFDILHCVALDGSKKPTILLRVGHDAPKYLRNGAKID